MNIGSKIKECREKHGLSQDELASKVFVSRQTISNWENNKNCPDIKSLTLLCNVFHITLDELVKDDVEEMKANIDENEIKKFNLLGYIYFLELVLVVVSAYPLAKFADSLGIVIWISLVIAAFATALYAEKLKKRNNIWTYKEILAFTEKRQLTHDESQQELGKRVYQQILIAILAAVLGFAASLVIIFVFDKLW